MVYGKPLRAVILGNFESHWDDITKGRVEKVPGNDLTSLMITKQINDWEVISFQETNVSSTPVVLTSFVQLGTQLI